MNTCHADAPTAVREHGRITIGPTSPAPSCAAASGAAITVLLASARRSICATWQPWLARQATLSPCGEPTTHGHELPDRLQRGQPDVLLLDRPLFVRLGPAPLSYLNRHHPRVSVLLLADEAYPGVVHEVLSNGFHGFLPTPSAPQTRLHAIHAVSDGELWLSRSALSTAVTELFAHSVAGGPKPTSTQGPDSTVDALTPREAQIVAFVRRGCTNKEIALELGIMEDTVKKHLQHVFSKLGVHRRTLVALAPRAVSA